MVRRDRAVADVLKRGESRRAASEDRRRWGPPLLRDLRNWSGRDWRDWIARFAMLNAGLALFAVGLVLSLQSNLGANSWTVFHDGIDRHTPLTIGQASQVVGLLMIAVSWLGGIRPGIGTLCNMYLVGWFMDLILEHGWVPLAQAYPLRVTMLLASLAVLGVATGVYIKAGFGAGPRDSFNLSLMELTGWSIGKTRWAIEVTVVVVGILLGGRFGVGTIISAFLIGPAVGMGFRLVGLPRGSKGRRGETATRVPEDGQGTVQATIIGGVEPVED